MQDKVIPSNATIHDVMPTLSNAEKYIAGVLSRLHECKTKYGNASVRIGTTGQGMIPYYRIVFEEPDTKTESIFGAFYGDNHAAFKTLEQPNKTWSSAAMSYHEVQQLLGKIRGWKGKKKS